ncbi:unnamed protein product [Paramecium sonneborni]|uniref:Uncharacterized protein n=1 Tax=Paramecium sonneborni TaxID=65129 RepID=A0A8S1RNL5_9CILI|nr:unnamed protein product [Paramecium sonneborni]
MMNNLKNLQTYQKIKKYQITKYQITQRFLGQKNEEKSQQFNKTFRMFKYIFIIYNEYFLKQQYNNKYQMASKFYQYNLLRALREPENFKYIKEI